MCMYAPSVDRLDLNLFHKHPSELFLRCKKMLMPNRLLSQKIREHGSQSIPLILIKRFFPEEHGYFVLWFAPGCARVN